MNGSYCCFVRRTPAVDHFKSKRFAIFFGQEVTIPPPPPLNILRPYANTHAYCTLHGWHMRLARCLSPLEKGGKPSRGWTFLSR